LSNRWHSQDFAKDIRFHLRYRPNKSHQSYTEGYLHLPLSIIHHFHRQCNIQPLDSKLGLFLNIHCYCYMAYISHRRKLVHKY
jgi:hypothetical protein